MTLIGIDYNQQALAEAANTLADVFADEHIACRDMLQSVEYPGDNPPAVLSGNPIKFLNSRTPLYQRPPTCGEHTREVLDEFGIATDR